MAAALLCLIAISGCGGDGGDDGSTVASGATELEGNWSKGCVPDGSGGSTLETLSFTGGSYKYTETSYDDASCGTQFLYFQYTGTFTLTGSASAPSGAKNWDQVYTAATLTPESGTAASTLNGMSYCGLTNWASGTAVSLIGKTCNGIAYTNPDHYDIYELSGSTLTVGDTLGIDNTSAANRPTSLEATSYTKQ